MSGKQANQDFDDLVMSGKVQTYDWPACEIAVQVASKTASSREDRIRLADAVMDSAAKTAGYFLHRRKA